MTTPNLLTTRQVAEQLGVTHGRVRQLVQKNELPSQKIGRARYITQTAVDKFQKTRRKVGRPLGSVVYRLDVLGRRRRVHQSQDLDEREAVG